MRQVKKSAKSLKETPLAATCIVLAYLKAAYNVRRSHRYFLESLRRLFFSFKMFLACSGAMLNQRVLAQFWGMFHRIFQKISTEIKLQLAASMTHP